MKVNIVGKGVIPGLNILAPVYNREISKAILFRAITSKTLTVFDAETGIQITVKNFAQHVGVQTNPKRPIQKPTATKADFEKMMSIINEHKQNAKNNNSKIKMNVDPDKNIFETIRENIDKTKTESTPINFDGIKERMAEVFNKPVDEKIEEVIDETPVVNVETTEEVEVIETVEELADEVIDTDDEVEEIEFIGEDIEESANGDSEVTPVINTTTSKKKHKKNKRG